MVNNNSVAIKKAESLQQKFITKVYSWMTLALLISGITAYFVANNNFILNLLFGNKMIGFWVLIISEIVLVFLLSYSIAKLSSSMAFVFFILYSVINGATLSTIFFAYDATSIIITFLVSALMFLGMSIYGLVSKSNILSARRYLFMGLTGIIVASIVNVFLKSSGFAWIISLVSVVIFTGLTAYDTRKMLLVSKRADGSEMFEKASILGALELYLDFINIFLSLLRLFGKSKN